MIGDMGIRGLVEFETLMPLFQNVKDCLIYLLRKEKKAMMEYIELSDGEGITIDGKGYAVQVMNVGSGSLNFSELTDSGSTWRGKIDAPGESFSYTDKQYYIEADGACKVVICKQWLV